MTNKWNAVAVGRRTRQRTHRASLVMVIASVMFPLRVWGQADAAPAKSPSPSPDTSSVLRIWIGASSLAMKDFNAKLGSEQNNPVGTGFTVAGEVDAIPVPNPVLKTASLKIPLGAEAIGATSETAQTVNGVTTTVNWSLPVFGVYLSPRMSFPRGKLLINLRPIGVGYYWLGHFLGASELEVSDRPGTLEASANAWGYIGLGGLEYPVDKATVLVEGGYRRLRFTDVTLTPKNGFTEGPVGAGAVVVQAGNLPQTLDYSGWMLRVGIGIRL
jgi:hypothetical protein